MPIISQGAMSSRGFGEFALQQTAPYTGPTIRASTTAGGLNATTIIKPTGVVAGDLLIICASIANNTTGFIGCPGFTSATSTTSPISAVLYKVAGASEPSSYGVTFSNTNADTSITMFAVTTGTYSTGIVNIGTWSTSGTGTTITAPALTVTNANSLLIAHYGVRASVGGNTTSTTTPTGMTATLGSPSSNAVSQLLSFNAVFSQNLTASGSTGTRATTITRTGTTSGHHGILFAIK